MTNEDFQRRKIISLIHKVQSEARLRKLEEIVFRFEETSSRQKTIFKENFIELRRAQARPDRIMKSLKNNTGKGNKGDFRQ
jgi:hypothetical protein